MMPPVDSPQPAPKPFTRDQGHETGGFTRGFDARKAVYPAPKAVYPAPKAVYPALYARFLFAIQGYALSDS